MRSDILPQEYCDALTKLRSDVDPMPWETVHSILEKAYGRDPEQIFSRIDQTALGSASIAQVHAAVLRSGQEVVIKVQREGIHEIMSRDIVLLRKAAELLKYTPARSFDFTKIVDEMWNTSQQEMNFMLEAGNLEEFAKNNRDVAYVSSPKVYPEYTTGQVLVMDCIGGIQIDDKKRLQEEGYDLDEIGLKLTDNYVKQITEDGFFHADPHPGNLRIEGDRIVWLDMGMMGRLSPYERKAITGALKGIAENDANVLTAAVLQLGEIRQEIDKKKLYQQCETLMNRYASQELGQMNLSAAVNDVLEVMKSNHIGMPKTLTMLARGLGTIEGLIEDISPSISITQAAEGRMSRALFNSQHLSQVLRKDGQMLYDSATKAMGIPALSSDLMNAALRGDLLVEVENIPGSETKQLAMRITRKLSGSFLCGAGLLAAALEDVGSPLLFGLSWFGWICAGIAAAAGYLTFIRDFIKKPDKT